MHMAATEILWMLATWYYSTNSWLIQRLPHIKTKYAAVPGSKFCAITNALCIMSSLVMLVPEQPRLSTHSTWWPLAQVWGHPSLGLSLVSGQNQDGANGTHKPTGWAERSHLPFRHPPSEYSNLCREIRSQSGWHQISQPAWQKGDMNGWTQG